jgi:hypothetical protein
MLGAAVGVRNQRQHLAPVPAGISQCQQVRLSRAVANSAAVEDDLRVVLVDHGHPRPTYHHQHDGQNLDADSTEPPRSRRERNRAHRQRLNIPAPVNVIVNM